MTLTQQIEIKADYLRVTLSGEFSLPRAKILGREMFETAAQHGQTKILVDIRAVTGNLSLFDRYEYVVFMVGVQRAFMLQGFPNLKAAFLGSEPVIDPGHIGEIMAINRGASVKATTSEQEAFAFLGLARPQE